MRLALAGGERNALVAQIRADAALLAAQHVMDYSLLLGVHYPRRGDEPWKPPQVPPHARHSLPPAVAVRPPACGQEGQRGSRKDQGGCDLLGQLPRLLQPLATQLLCRPALSLCPLPAAGLTPFSSAA